MKDIATFALRLPNSIKSAAAKIAQRDGTSMNQFVATAVAEKIAIMETTAYFQQFKDADMDAFSKFMGRGGGEAPREGDAL